MNKLKFLLMFSMSLLLVGCSSDEEENDSVSQDNLDTTAEVEAVESETPEIPESISYEIEFGSGNYTAGIDFPEGKYDIVAISGSGNVSSSNSFSGGINAMMGTEDANEFADLYEQEYKNIELPNGEVLSVSGGVTIKISSDEASGKALAPRNQSITETITLGNGNFVSGEDFPAGIYDLIAISGGGNVSSDNIFDGGINAIMGTEDQNTFGNLYEPQYKNVELPEGVTLKIDGVELQLVPSK